MKIHEYQAKQILSRSGVSIPKGKIARTSGEARQIAQQLGGTVAVKAQIHAGGRGKGGGVKIAKNPSEAEALSKQMLGSKLITPQTGSEGREVQCVLVEKGLDIEKEFYLGIVIDRSCQMPVLMASREGGMEIEEVAHKNPDLILKEYIHPTAGLSSDQALKIAVGLGLEDEGVNKAVVLIMSLYQSFQSTDASLIEINPLVMTRKGQILALDAKMDFDDNALYRHPEIEKMRDLSEEEPLEIEASRHHLNYIKLDGNVGCMVNGAGLAMATMDIIKLAGGSPANFLDVGGGANVDQIKNALKILLSDENVTSVLINIFGGILRCDVLAEGVVQAAKDIGINLPIVVRLEGTNVEEGRAILKKSGLDFEVADDMADAARIVSSLA